MILDKRSKIEGVSFFELREITDPRGSVLHMLRSDANDFAGFGEIYFSEVLPGAVKAWKRHSKQTQNLAVPSGRILLVLHDDRYVSPTTGTTQVIEIGRPDSYLRVRIPPGIWYGFSCVGDFPALIANCPDIPHDPAESESRPPDEESIPHSWISRGGVPQRK